MNDENNSSELSINDPMTEAAGLEAVLGMINPKETGQVENDSVPEAELEEDLEESYEEEVEETPDPIEDEELEESDEVQLSDDIELEDSEYDYLIAAKEFLNENGLDDIEKIKSGILMQGDYTRKTQALAEERKEFESGKIESLEQTAKLLETAQAMLYGEAPQYTTAELLSLKQTNPGVYEQALEQKILYEQKQIEINDLQQKTLEQYTAQQEEKQQIETQKQSELLLQKEPSFSDEKVAKQKVETMGKYLESIGEDPEILNTLTSASMIKVIHDAAMNSGSLKQVAEAKSTKKKATKTVIRKGATKSRAQKQAAAQKAKAKKAILPDGSIDQRSAVDLIFDSFN